MIGPAQPAALRPRMARGVSYLATPAPRLAAASTGAHLHGKAGVLALLTALTREDTPMATRSARNLGSPDLVAFGPVGTLPAVPDDTPPMREPDPPRGCTCAGEARRPPTRITQSGGACERCGVARAVPSFAATCEQARARAGEGMSSRQERRSING